MAEAANHHQPHVAAIAFPFGSHATQLLNITREFAIAAPEVTFSFFSTAKSNQSLFGSSCSSACPEFDNIKVYDVDDGIPENHVFSGHPLEEIELFIKATPNNFKKAIEKAVSDTNKKISCLTNDAFLWMVGNIAEELGVPWIPVWAPGASSLSSHFYTNLIRESTKGGNEPISFIPGMDTVRYCDLPEEIRRYSSQSLFCQMLDMAGEMMPRATAIAINSFEELECPIIKDLKSKIKICLAVGPLTVVSPSLSDSEDPHGCLSWLDDKSIASVAYISFGTKATPPLQELVALADGLEASEVPFLWSLKDYAKKNLPVGFLERTSGRGKVVPWTPQSKVLGHSAIGVIVTHCGWNSVLESIMDGVPIIYRPFFGDHMLIGRFVSTVWEIGVKVGDEGVFTKHGTVNALNLILCKEEGKKIRQKVKRLRELGKQALGPTGSTTKNFNTLLEIVTIQKK
ncbi:hypothetical protein AQUCO_03100072v1 [Aquilegia coerulea]|uniref:Glycosyltransferase n=1 Tax=Aquilegia coerulea TaxID=218851 RepID=A0A2G5D0L9_AQUCA|nr:hypothetical protein AQUCO_03100072v1 [Aquilegia coerulea]